MPEYTTNTDICPVNLFQTYPAKLNPNNDRLWQYPRESFDESWYQNRPIGRDKFSTFMFKKVPLSMVYTNHSICVTGVSILGRAFSTPQILAVSGQRIGAICSNRMYACPCTQSKSFITNNA